MTASPAQPLRIMIRLPQARLAACFARAHSGSDERLLIAFEQALTQALREGAKALWEAQSERDRSSRGPVEILRSLRERALFEMRLRFDCEARLMGGSRAALAQAHERFWALTQELNDPLARAPSLHARARWPLLADHQLAGPICCAAIESIGGGWALRALADETHEPALLKEAEARLAAFSQRREIEGALGGSPAARERKGL